MNKADAYRIVLQDLIERRVAIDTVITYIREQVQHQAPQEETAKVVVQSGHIPAGPVGSYFSLATVELTPTSERSRSPERLVNWMDAVHAISLPENLQYNTIDYWNGNEWQPSVLIDPRMGTMAATYAGTAPYADTAPTH